MKRKATGRTLLQVTPTAGHVRPRLFSSDMAPSSQEVEQSPIPGRCSRVPGKLPTMPTMADVRGWALSLPESTELPHHDIGSFRVRGKIFATVPDDEHVRIMVDEHEVLAAAAAHPGVCHPVSWGERVSCVAVEIGTAPAELIRDLLTEAWLRKAPASLAKKFTDSQ